MHTARQIMAVVMVALSVMLFQLSGSLSMESAGDQRIGVILSVLGSLGSVLGCLCSEKIMKRDAAMPFYIQKFHQEMGGLAVSIALLFLLPLLGSVIDASVEGGGSNAMKNSLFAWKASFAVRADVASINFDLYIDGKNDPCATEKLFAFREEELVTAESGIAHFGSLSEFGSLRVKQAVLSRILQSSAADVERFAERKELPVHVLLEKLARTAESARRAVLYSPFRRELQAVSAAELEENVSLVAGAALPPAWQGVYEKSGKAGEIGEGGSERRGTRRDESQAGDAEAMPIVAGAKQEKKFLAPPAEGNGAAPSMSLASSGSHLTSGAPTYCKMIDANRVACFTYSDAAGRWELRFRGGDETHWSAPVLQSTPPHAPGSGVPDLGALGISARDRFRVAPGALARAGQNDEGASSAEFSPLEGEALFLAELSGVVKSFPARRETSFNLATPEATAAGLQGEEVETQRPSAPAAILAVESSSEEKSLDPAEHSISSAILVLKGTTAPGQPLRPQAAHDNKKTSPIVCDAVACPLADFRGYRYLFDEERAQLFSGGMLSGDYQRGFFSGWDMPVFWTLLWMLVSFWQAGLLVKNLSSLWKNVGQCVCTVFLCLWEVTVIQPAEADYGAQRLLSLVIGALVVVSWVFVFGDQQTQGGGHHNHPPGAERDDVSSGRSPDSRGAGNTESQEDTTDVTLSNFSEHSPCRARPLLQNPPTLVQEAVEMEEKTK
eukprot:g13314.t1